MIDRKVNTGKCVEESQYDIIRIGGACKCEDRMLVTVKGEKYF